MELTKKQIDTRVAVLKRLKSLLQEQKQKFCFYLTALEAQQEKIQLDDIDALMQHTKLEENIVSNILSLQKVITPINDMYQTTIGHSAQDSDIVNLKSQLENLKTKVLKQNKDNSILLQRHFQEVKKQLMDLHNPYQKAKSIYTSAKDTGSLVHISC